MATALTQTLSLHYFRGNNIQAPAVTTNTPSVDIALDGFPARYEGERVWVGAEMALKQEEWILQLSPSDQQEILKALRHFQSLHLGPQSLSRETFPLSEGLGGRLRAISRDCYEGRGFCILRGLNPDVFTDEENVLVFAGVSTYVGSRRGFQDVKRDLVTCHVISEERKPGAEEQKLRPAFTNGPVAFHTDIGDILSLYAMDVSETGGETMIVSSSQIYNEVVATRPDLLQELSHKWACFHAQNYETDGTPLLNNTPGDKLVLQYSRIPVTGFRTLGPNPSLPPPSPKRLEAMNTLEALATKLSFNLPRVRGDIAYINNMCLMHARNAFDVDAEGNPLDSKRHLVKMILQDPQLMWEMPNELGWVQERLYGPNTEDGRRVERWQLDVRDGMLPDGKVWIGTGSQGNG